MAKQPIAENKGKAGKTKVKGQTSGQSERDPKGRTGHFTGAGDPAIKQEMRSKGPTRGKGESKRRNR